MYCYSNNSASKCRKSKNLVNISDFQATQKNYYVEKHINNTDILNKISQSLEKILIRIDIRTRSNLTDLNGTVISFSNIQIEEGSTATSYELYGTNGYVNIE